MRECMLTEIEKDTVSNASYSTRIFSEPTNHLDRTLRKFASLPDSRSEAKEQTISLYATLMKRLGVSDPIAETTGRTFEETYDSLHKPFHKKQNIFSPLTFIVRSDIHPHIKTAFSIGVTSTTSISGKKLLFSTTGKFLSDERGYLINGILTLDSEIVTLCGEYGEPVDLMIIEKELEDISILFNHDVTAHGTFLPSSEHALFAESVGEDEVADVVASFNHSFPNSYGTLGFNGEKWSTLFHADLFKEIIKQNPAVLRALIFKAHVYCSAIQKVADTAPQEKREQIIGYMNQVYGFMLLRLVSLEKIQSVAQGKKLITSFPDIIKTDPVEESWRTSIHTSSDRGLASIREDGSYPHKEVFKTGKRLNELIQETLDGVALLNNDSLSHNECAEQLKAIKPVLIPYIVRQYFDVITPFSEQTSMGYQLAKSHAGIDIIMRYVLDNLQRTIELLAKKDFDTFFEEVIANN